MNYLTSQIKSLISSSAVATSAGIAAADWSNHVFVTYDLAQFCYSINVGRLPIVCIQELSSNYESQATSQNEVGGTVTPVWTIRVMANAFANRREANYQLINKIKAAIMKAISQDRTFEFRVSNVASGTINPIATYVDFTIEAENTFTDTINEE